MLFLLLTGIKFCVGLTIEFKELVDEMIRQDVFPDYMAVDGAEGGTGASPKAFMDGYGMPLMPALYSVNSILTDLGVRDRTKIIPVGITTHDPELQRGLVVEDKAERVANYVHGLEHDFYEMLAASGIKNAKDITMDQLYIPNDTALADQIELIITQHKKELLNTTS